MNFFGKGAPAPYWGNTHDPNMQMQNVIGQAVDQAMSAFLQNQSQPSWAGVPGGFGKGKGQKKGGKGKGKGKSNPPQAAVNPALAEPAAPALATPPVAPTQPSSLTATTRTCADDSGVEASTESDSDNPPGQHGYTKKLRTTRCTCTPCVSPSKKAWRVSIADSTRRPGKKPKIFQAITPKQSTVHQVAPATRKLSKNEVASLDAASSAETPSKRTKARLRKASALAPAAEESGLVGLTGEDKGEGAEATAEAKVNKDDL